MFNGGHDERKRKPQRLIFETWANETKTIYMARYHKRQVRHSAATLSGTPVQYNSSAISIEVMTMTVRGVNYLFVLAATSLLGREGG